MIQNTIITKPRIQTNYKFLDHIHNYAVWTAARAVQRGFTSTENIKIAIDGTTLQKFSNSLDQISSSQFDTFHKKTAGTLISIFAQLGLDVSYGRAAKIIAIYLKTAVILPRCGKDAMCKIIHPPIDRILLKNLHQYQTELGLNSIKWTQLSEPKYFTLIQKLRQLNYDYFWQIETFWYPA